MTNEEAREALKELKMYSEDLSHYSSDEVSEALEMAIKALEQPTAEDCISRQAVLDIWHTRYSNNREENDEIQFKKIAFELPSVTPSHEDLKEAYIKGYDYGVKDWFKAKTEKPDIKAEIINRIEQVRDNDMNVGEYPYNRCIEIIKEVMG